MKTTKPPTKPPTKTLGVKQAAGSQARGTAMPDSQARGTAMPDSQARGTAMPDMMEQKRASRPLKPVVRRGKRPGD